jgi:hypothetical protein
MAGIATRAYAFARSLFGASATISVAQGGDLQAALNAAQPGDVIELAAGARFIGQYKFPPKSGIVTLCSAGPLPDRRITPADAPLLATIASPYAMMAVDFYDSANWILDGVRFEANVGGAGEVIGIQNGHNITLRRLLIDLPDPQQQKRFILGNGTNITLTQSHIAGIWREGQDSQAFCAWDGAGPYTITDNYLEAASENVMFGGADSSSDANRPKNILIERNTFTKRLSWKGDAVVQVVKNLLEFKDGSHITVRHNLFENIWGGEGQAGWAIMITPRNQGGSAPWTRVEHFLFELNTIRAAALGIDMTGYDNNGKSGQTANVVMRDNDINVEGLAFLLQDDLGSVEIYWNRITSGAAWLSLEAGISWASGSMQPSKFAVRALTLAENITTSGSYIHSPKALGEDALKLYCEAYRLTMEPPIDPPIDPPIPPIVLTDRDRIEEALLLLRPMEQALTGKALSNLRNIVTRLQTLLGQVP